MIVIAGRMRFEAEKLPHALDVIRPVVAATRDEPGNVAYGYHADVDEPDTLFLFEEWESDEALDAHFEKPYVLEFLQTLPTLGLLSASVYRYDVIGKSLMG